MPRASRYYLPGNIWHITHRCHNRDFLFRSIRDRMYWIYSLSRTRKRFEIKILNYVVTSNHIHLLVKDDSDDRRISRFMQYLQGITAQVYNEKKKRKGAFWEDRYHATAIESDSHLIQCMVYIDLNMVRAGVVKHPSEWKESGYYEMLSPRKRNVIIDYTLIFELLHIDSVEELLKFRNLMVNAALTKNQLNRESRWTESVAVGSQLFLERIKHQLGNRAKGRSIIGDGENLELSESEIPYNADLGLKFDI